MNQKGQSLFEIIVALAVSTLIIIALVALASTSIKNSTYSRNNTVATRYVQQAMEWLRSERDSDWDSFYLRGSNTSSWCLTSLDWSDSRPEQTCQDDEFITNTFFYRTVHFTPGSVNVNGVDKDFMDVLVKVYWTDTQGLHEVTSTTRFSDWRDLQI